MRNDLGLTDTLIETAKSARRQYTAQYNLSDVRLDAVNIAPQLRAASARRLRNRLLALSAAALVVLAGFTIHVPVSSSSSPAAKQQVRPNIWQAITMLALSGLQVNSQEEVEDTISQIAQQLFDRYSTRRSYKLFKNMSLPEDIRTSLGCSITKDFDGPDLLRAGGKRGGISRLGRDVRVDRAQFGWRPIRDELSSIAGYPLNSEVKPFDDLTASEKALVAPLYEAQPYLGGVSMKVAAGDLMVDFLVAAAEFAAGDQLTADDLVYLWLGATASAAERDAARAFTKPEAERWLARNFMVPVVSPVTGRIFEPDHPKFSRGNGFITEITGAEDIAKLKAAIKKANVLVNKWNAVWAYVEAPEGYDLGSIDEAYDCRWFYFRLYGEESVIAEGVYVSWWDERPWQGPIALFTRPVADFPGSLYVPWNMRESGIPRSDDLWKLAFKPATDYEAWLLSQSRKELADIVWRVSGESAQGFAPISGRTIRSVGTPTDVQALRQGNIQGLRAEDIGGLPTEDPLPSAETLDGQDIQFIEDALSGERSAVAWFASTGVNRLTSPIQWLMAVYTTPQLQEIVRAYSMDGHKGAMDKAKSFGSTYAVSVGGVFLPIYRDFESYQGYFERLVEPEALVKVERSAGHPVKDAIYFRLYGTERVIAEGVWAE